MEKVIEVNLGIGMIMLVPEPVKIVIEDDTDYEKLKKSYERYLEFCKTLEEPDYDYLMDDPNEYKVREFTLEEFIEIFEKDKKFQEKFVSKKPKKRRRKPSNVKPEIEIEKE